MISIVMAAYNAEKYIGDALQSVFSQTYKDWEMIIVDDCSTDGTLSIIRKTIRTWDATHEENPVQKKIRLIQNDNNLGAGKTRKHACEQARGEWIAILDSDDLWEPEKLSKQMALVADGLSQTKNLDLSGKENAIEDIELVYTGSEFIDEDNHILQYTLHVPGKIKYRELLKQNLISDSSVLIKRTLLIQNMVTEKNLHEDFACWLQILKTGKVAYGIAEPLLIYRVSKKSKSGNKLKSAVMNWRTYRYVGLSNFEATYYMMFYVFRGLRKYRRIYKND